MSKRKLHQTGQVGQVSQQQYFKDYAGIQIGGKKDFDEYDRDWKEYYYYGGITGNVGSGGITKTGGYTAATKKNVDVDLEKCITATIGYREVYITPTGELFVIAEDDLGGKVIRPWKELDVKKDLRDTKYLGKVLTVPESKWIVRRAVLKRWGKELTKYGTEVGGVKGMKEVDGKVKYLLVIPEQEVSAGSVDGDNWHQATEYLIKEGYTPIGTLHTHPGDMACLSGTDKTSWEKFGGVHTIITQQGTMVDYYSCGGIVSAIIHKEEKLWEGVNKGVHKKCAGIVSYTGSKNYWKHTIKQKVISTSIGISGKGKSVEEKSTKGIGYTKDAKGAAFEIGNNLWAIELNNGMYHVFDEWGNRLATVSEDSLDYLGKNSYQGKKKASVGHVKADKGFNFSYREAEAMEVYDSFIEDGGLIPAIDKLNEVEVLPILNSLSDIGDCIEVFYNDNEIMDMLAGGGSDHVLGFAGTLSTRALLEVKFHDALDTVKGDTLSRVLVKNGKSGMSIVRLGKLMEMAGTDKKILERLKVAADYMALSKSCMKEVVKLLQEPTKNKEVLMGFGELDLEELGYDMNGLIITSYSDIAIAITELINELED